MNTEQKKAFRGKSWQLLLFAMILYGSAFSQGFPGTDSLRNYNTRYITNNPNTAFTNLRLHTLLRGVIDWIDTARISGGGGGGSLGVDTIYAINDSTIRYRKSGVFRNVVIKGVYDSRRKVDSMYQVNDSTIGFLINGVARTFIVRGSSAWRLTGNSGTDPSNFIGTTDERPLRFRTNNVERVIIDSSSGKVWIINGPDTLTFIAGSESIIRASAGTDLSLVTDDVALKVGGIDKLTITGLNNGGDPSIDSLLVQNSSGTVRKMNTASLPFQKKTIVGNGLTETSDSTLLGGNLTKPTYIKVDNRTMAGATRTGLAIGNTEPDSATSYTYWQTPTGIYNEPVPALSIHQAYYDNDTVPKHYGGAIFGKSRWTFSSGLKRYTDPLKRFYPLYGGSYMVSQIFPPDSMYIDANWAGRIPAAYAGDLAIGGNNGYWLNVWSDYRYPMAAMRLGIDYARQTSTVKREIYGQGTSIYVADYRNHQSAINAGSTELGSYVNKIYLFHAFGPLSNRDESPSKAKTLAVSTVDTVVGVYVEPQNTLKNETRNGYGFVSAGSRDFNYLAGKQRIGGIMPTEQNGGQANQLEVTGTSSFSSNVGIGTTNPLSRLHVVSDYGFRVESQIVGGFPQMSLYNHRGNRYGAIGGRNSDRSLSVLADSGNIHFYTTVLGDPTSRFRMGIKQGGNVWISSNENSTDTTSRFTVSGTGAFRDTLTITTMGNADSSHRAASTAFVNRMIALKGGGGGGSGIVSFTDGNGFAGTIVGTDLSLTTQLTTGSIPYIGSGGALTQNNSSFRFDPVNSRLGVGITAPSAKIHSFVSSSESAWASILERQTTGTNAALTTSAIQATSTGNMVDGFGPAMLFQIKDNAGVDNPIATIAAVRSGADNSGAITFNPINAGGLSEKMRILPNGNVGIGTNNPTSTLQVSGNVSASSTIAGTGLTLSGLAGTGTRLGTVSSTGVSGAITNGTDGQVMTMVSGAPAWSAAPTGGTYNPTFSNLGTGVSSVAATGSKVWYTRVGNIVTITGRIEPIFSSGTTGDHREFTMSLPPGITANLTDPNDAQGVANCTWSTTRTAMVNWDASNDVIKFDVQIGTEGYTDARAVHFTVTFQIP